MLCSPTSIQRDPDSVKPWTFDLTDWLETDTISSHTAFASTGLTVDSSSNTSTSVTVWLSGGTVGQRYTLTVRVVTAAGVTDDGSVAVLVVEH